MIVDKSKSQEKFSSYAIIPNVINLNNREHIFEIEELNEPQLLSRAHDLFSNNPTQIFEAINFFDIYLYFYKVPLNVSIEIQPFFVKLFSIEDIPRKMSEPSLRIISSISSSFSEKFNYSSFFSDLWNFLPSSNAFDAIASLVAANNAAAIAITEPPFLPLLQEFLVSNDFPIQSGALGIFNSIACHPELTNSLIEIFSQILEIHKNAEATFKIQCYETFINLISNRYWCDFFVDSSDLPSIFQIDESDNYDGQLIAALRFLKALILISEVNPEELILNAEAIPLIIDGFSNQNQIVQNESFYIIENTIKRLTYIPEFIWSSDIIQILFDKNNDLLNNGDFNIFQFTTHTLCMICERASEEEMLFFIDNNFVSILCEYIDSIDKPLLNDSLLAILKIMASSISLDDDKIINEISYNEQFISFISKCDLEPATIILRAISKINSQDQE